VSQYCKSSTLPNIKPFRKRTGHKNELVEQHAHNVSQAKKFASAQHEKAEYSKANCKDQNISCPYSTNAGNNEVTIGLYCIINTAR